MSTSASATRHRLHQHRSAMGFTMVELVVVMVLVGVLAAVAVPKMGAMLSSRDDAWRDGLLDAMRHAQKLAVSHRRLVCATVDNTQVTLQIATTNPATTCDANYVALSGNGPVFASSTNPAMTTAVSPSGVIYFQPDGRSTTDGAGNNTSNRTLTPAGLSVISIIGETGHAQ